MKRKITPMILLAVLMSVGMTACGNTNAPKQSNTNYENFEKPSQDDINYTSEEIEEEESTEQYEQSLTGNGTGDIYVPDEEDLAIEDEATLAQQEAQEADEQIQSEPEQTTVEESDYTVTPMTEQTMYAQQSVNLRQGPSTEYDKVGSLSTNQSVTITGYAETASGKWYQLSTGEFVSAKYLGTDKVVVQAPSNNSNTSNNNSSNSDSNTNSNTSQSSSSSEEKTVTSSGSGDGSGSSRANRSGADDNWGGDGAITGGNLH